MTNITLPDFSSPEIWVSMLTLTFLEIVLGVDNIIFVSIVANKLPKNQQAKGRNVGLLLALVFRLLLLLIIGWIISLNKPVISIPFIKEAGIPLGISIKDLILIAGGLFLIYKSTTEIRGKLEGDSDEIKTNDKSTFMSVILQITVVNIVFSFDSILTAIGLTKEIFIMMVAVIASIGVMMIFSEAVSKFINTHPTMQMLALSFLILIGMMLIVEGFHQHVSKGYVYFAIAFSLLVEVLNMRLRKKSQISKVKLHQTFETKDDFE
jgi:predicted tellurium resistance membrane protein TerC